MKPDFLNCRLWHKDYEMPESITDILKIQKQALNDLIEKFKQSFFPNKKAYIKGTKICCDSDIWYYDFSHSYKTTLVFFAKWPTGIHIVFNQDYLIENKNIQEMLQTFSISEKEWFAQTSRKNKLALLNTISMAFQKCYAYYNKGNKPNMNEWKLFEENNIFYYSNNNKQKYEFQMGTSEPQYTFCVCKKLF